MRGANEHGGTLLLFNYTSLMAALANPGPYQNALIYFRDAQARQLDSGGTGVRPPEKP